MKKALLISFVFAFGVSALWPTGSAIGIAVSFLLSMVLLAKKEVRFQPKYILPFTAYFVWLLAGLLWTDNFGEGQRNVEVQLSFLFMPVVASALVQTGFTRVQFKKVLYGTLALSIGVMLYEASTHVPESTWIEAIAGSQLSLPFMHRAYFMNYIALAIILWLWDDEAMDARSIMGLVGLVIAFWILQGRMNILVLAGVLGIALVWGIIAKKKRVYSGVGIIALVLGLSVYADFIPSRFDEDVSNEMQTTEDGVPQKNSRFFIWEMAFNAFSEQPVIGVGTGDVQDALNHQYEEVGYTFALVREYNAHNQYLQTAVTGGAIGLIALLMCFLLPFVSAIKERDVVLLLWLVTVAGVILTESYFVRFHGVFVFASVTPLLWLTTKRA